MGTRNLTIVKSKGKTKVAQYGQWDGYPTGQGQTISDFLKKADIKKFREEVDKLREITDEDKKLLEADDWKEKFPYMSRDTGANILQMIQDGIVKFVYLDEAFKEDGLFCEYFYTLNLDDETISMNDGKKYTFKQWTRKGLMKTLENRDED